MHLITHLCSAVQSCLQCVYWCLLMHCFWWVACKWGWGSEHTCVYSVCWQTSGVKEPVSGVLWCFGNYSAKHILVHVCSDFFFFLIISSPLHFLPNWGAFTPEDNGSFSLVKCSSSVFEQHANNVHHMPRQTRYDPNFSFYALRCLRHCRGGILRHCLNDREGSESHVRSHL